MSNIRVIHPGRFIYFHYLNTSMPDQELIKTFAENVQMKEKDVRDFLIGQRFLSRQQMQRVANVFSTKTENIQKLHDDYTNQSLLEFQIWSEGLCETGSISPEFALFDGKIVLGYDFMNACSRALGASLSYSGGLIDPIPRDYSCLFPTQEAAMSETMKLLHDDLYKEVTYDRKPFTIPKKSKLYGTWMK